MEAVKSHKNGTGFYDAGGLTIMESPLPYADTYSVRERPRYYGRKKAENAAKRLYEKYNPDVVVITQGKTAARFMTEHALRFTRHFP
ncbi:MAG: hypothetical protein ACLR56_02495 [Oscillospiraceae bacterium]